MLHLQKDHIIQRLSDEEFFILSESKTASTPGIVKCDPKRTMNKKEPKYIKYAVLVRES